MGNFLVTIASPESQHHSASLFRSGVEMVRFMKDRVPSGKVETDWARAATFSRMNSSGSALVSDPATGSWLLSIGTWFHSSNDGTASESFLLRQFLDIGPIKLAQQLEGFFVVVAGDARTREVAVMTDTIGSCHCFIRVHGTVCAISSSSMLLAGLEDYSLDPVGCQEFLSTGVIYENRTFYREVRKLGPASVYLFSDGRLKAEQRYWHITDLSPESLDGQVAVTTLGDRLVNAAQQVGKRFSHPVCDLTGGYDSRAVVAAFLTAGVPFSTTVSGLLESPDVRISRGLAQIAGLPHLHVDSEKQPSFSEAREAVSLTDGEYDLLEYARISSVHRILARRFDISVNGSFGEVARGYWWELLFPRAGKREKLNSQRLAKLRFSTQNFDVSLFPSEEAIDPAVHLSRVIERTIEGQSHLPNTMQMDHVYLTMRMQRWQGRIASSTNQIWPCLSLFMFRSVLEAMLQTTTRMRRRSLLIRHLLAKLQPHFSEYPLEHGYPAMPVSWTNFPRFFPLLVHLGQRAVCKLGRTAGVSFATTSPQNAMPPARLLLWGDEEVRELFRPSAMMLGRTLNRTPLEKFLDRSQQLNFSYNEQWMRLLSLEVCLRRLESIKLNLLSKAS